MQPATCEAAPNCHMAARLQPLPPPSRQQAVEGPLLGVCAGAVEQPALLLVVAQRELRGPGLARRATRPRPSRGPSLGPCLPCCRLASSGGRGACRAREGRSERGTAAADAGSRGSGLVERRGREGGRPSLLAAHPRQRGQLLLLLLLLLLCRRRLFRGAGGLRERRGRWLGRLDDVGICGAEPRGEVNPQAAVQSKQAGRATVAAMVALGSAAAS